MKPWKTLRKQTIHNQPPWLVVEHHLVELPDGRRIPEWPWVITPDYVNIVAVTEQGEFLCFRQVKYGLEGTTLGIIGGYIEPGEAPLAAAQRELREETGCEAGQWIKLGEYLVDPNRGIATGHLYLAIDVRRVTDPVPDDLEEQHLIYLSRLEIEAALDRGEIKILAWAAAIAFALRYIDSRGEAFGKMNSESL